MKSVKHMTNDQIKNKANDRNGENKMNTEQILKNLPQELKDVLCVNVLLELDSSATVSDYYDMFPRVVGDNYENSELYKTIRG